MPNIVLRNQTRWPLVFQVSSNQGLSWAKLYSVPTLQPAGVVMVDLDAGAIVRGSLPSSDFTYGDSSDSPYFLVQFAVPSGLPDGSILDVQDNLLVDREPSPTGTTSEFAQTHSSNIPAANQLQAQYVGSVGSTKSSENGALYYGLLVLLIAIIAGIVCVAVCTLMKHE